MAFAGFQYYFLKTFKEDFSAVRLPARGKSGGTGPPAYKKNLLFRNKNRSFKNSYTFAKEKNDNYGKEFSDR